jgi:hypothetical protein
VGNEWADMMVVVVWRLETSYTVRASEVNIIYSAYIYTTPRLNPLTSSVDSVNTAMSILLTVRLFLIMYPSECGTRAMAMFVVAWAAKEDEVGI